MGPYGLSDLRSDESERWVGKYEVSLDALVCRFHHSQRKRKLTVPAPSLTLATKLYSRISTAIC